MTVLYVVVLVCAAISGFSAKPGRTPQQRRRARAIREAYYR
jgi:hypothetical protein